ncbi:unnamed protein product [Orchesella dallaii]|uniref:F-box domain-containing protein n=1 Tax=Orchesella dallaii TaxID=48710 RepID=A0ABP1QHN5_9HEXA
MYTLETHPLFVDLVLEKLFQYLPEKDLKSCRLVCTKWYAPATKALQRACKPIVFGILYKINLIRIRPDLDTIQQFMNAMSASQYGDIRRELPFVKFDIRPYMLAPPFMHLLKQFLLEYGSAMQSLNIKLAFESADDFSKDCFGPLELSSLKSLEFCNSVHGELRPSLITSMRTSRGNLLESILNAAPFLESLSLWCDSENIVWPRDAINVLKDMKLRYLQNLKISFPMTDDCLISLSEINAQLTSLTFVLREPMFNPEEFKQILDSQRNTLKTLKLIDLQCSGPKIIEIPFMSQLETLEIEGTFYGENSTMALGNFSYAKLPKLKRILLSSCHKINFDLNAILYTSGNKGTVCHTLEEFQFSLDHNCCDLSGNCVRRLKQVFPNLRKLSVIFTSEAKWVLNSVFEHLTSLSELVINVRKCGTSIDCALTGIPPNMYEHLVRTGMYKLGPLSLDPRQLLPSITNLKGLKYLEIAGETDANSSKRFSYNNSNIVPFTEFSVYMAFLKMRRLGKLIFRQTGHHLPQDVITKLASTVDFVHVK